MHTLRRAPTNTRGQQLFFQTNEHVMNEHGWKSVLAQNQATQEKKLILQKQDFKNVQEVDKIYTFYHFLQLKSMTWLSELDLSSNDLEMNLASFFAQIDTLLQLQIIKLNRNSFKHQEQPQAHEQEQHHSKKSSSNKSQQCSPASPLPLDATALVDIRKFGQLKQIHLRNNSIKCWPCFLEASTTLSLIDLSFNELHQVKTLASRQRKKQGKPRSAGTQVNVQQILKSIFNFSSTVAPSQVADDVSDLDKVKKSIHNHTSQVTHIDLSCNQIREFPDALLWDFPQLRILHLSFNKMPTLPSGNWSQVKHLTELYLNGCELQSFPVGLCKSNLPIQVLELAENPDMLQATTTTTTTTTQLNTNIHKELENLTWMSQLTSINMNACKLQDIRCLLLIPNLKILRAEKNKIKALPLDELQDFGSLSNLQELHLTCNELTVIPAELNKACGNLQVLKLAHNKIASFPAISCAQLQHLDLKANALTALPILDTCMQLTYLDISKNQLTCLEEQLFARAPKLQHFDASFNQLQALPEMKGMNDLCIFLIQENQLTEFPAHLYTHCQALHVCTTT